MVNAQLESMISFAIEYLELEKIYNVYLTVFAYLLTIKRVPKGIQGEVFLI